MRARGHVLGARFHPLYRVSSGFLRSHRTDCHLRVAGDLDAKAATDIRGLHANAINVNIKMRREKLRSEEHTSELQSPVHLVCRLLLEKKNTLYTYQLSRERYPANSVTLPRFKN